MPKSLVRSNGYKALLNKVRKALIEGQQRIEQERVRTYWPIGSLREETGRVIYADILKHKDRAGYGEQVVLRLARDLSVDREDLFTYVAMVEKVIDGDTLLVSFDFQGPASVSQKLRLRGIDCPELDTEEGRRAKRFVESRLKDCDFIIVKTYKDRTDRFDRYLADIFCLPGVNDPALVAAEGAYLNQELLNERLAVMY